MSSTLINIPLIDLKMFDKPSSLPLIHYADITDPVRPYLVHEGSYDIRLKA